MIEEGIIAVMLIWIISRVEKIRSKLNYFNDRITLIEKKLRSCGIVALPQKEKDQEV